MAALAKAAGSAKLLAGGQSLGPMLNLRLARPHLLVDVSRLQALQQVEDIGRAWRIGAGVTHARLEDARGKLPGAAMLCEVAASIAYRSIRNRGSVTRRHCPSRAKASGTSRDSTIWRSWVCRCVVRPGKWA